MKSLGLMTWTDDVAACRRVRATIENANRVESCVSHDLLMKLYLMWLQNQSAVSDVGVVARPHRHVHSPSTCVMHSPESMACLCFVVLFYEQPSSHAHHCWRTHALEQMTSSWKLPVRRECLAVLELILSPALVWWAIRLVVHVPWSV